MIQQCIPEPPIDPDGEYGFEGHMNQMWSYPCGFKVSMKLQDVLDKNDDRSLVARLNEKHERLHNDHS